MNLSPAQWIWFPSQRTLANTFVLFRKEISLAGKPNRAIAWISADSRYRFHVNGQRVSWGPAPCDHRELDVDPVDLTSHLDAGRNVLAVEVLYYGVGDGTWVMGKPGFIFRLEVEYETLPAQQFVSDNSWQCFLDRAHRPGQYKRWFLRALQEEFDARLHPQDWEQLDFVPDGRWLPAMCLDAPADKPAFCSHYKDYLGESAAFPSDASSYGLKERTIPPLRETEIAALRLCQFAAVEWLRDPLDWFEFRIPKAFRITKVPLPEQNWEKQWLLSTNSRGAARLATFEFEEQVVGWPYFTIEASEGTIIELIIQESHEPEETEWLDSGHYSWSRFICREGINRFETFDFESLRWLQLHIRNASGSVRISDVGVRRRTFPWPNPPRIRCADPALQRLFDAGINTLMNSAQETCVDGMGRERQQYSGDGGHQLHAVRYVFGETRLPARFLRTFSKGLTHEGYFLDAWPGYDRLARLTQREVGASDWGPLLDHGVGFAFDCWRHYLETGDLQSTAGPYDNLRRFVHYLESLQDNHSLLPVENLGVPAVWIDHDAYHTQADKQCAFNLYVAAMLQHALNPLAVALHRTEDAVRYERLGQKILDATVRNFWDEAQKLFVNNLPRVGPGEAPRLCDRSLATAILFDQCPNGQSSACLDALATCPPSLGISYPCNAGWRYWALARLGRADVVLGDFRERWAKMSSVIENNSIQETWVAAADSTFQWSHCAVSPLYVLFMDIAGIRPITPGFKRCQIRPQLGDLEELDLTCYTPQGPIGFESRKSPAGHDITLSLPPGCEGELLVSKETGMKLSSPVAMEDHTLGLARYYLPAGGTHRFILK